MNMKRLFVTTFTLLLLVAFASDPAFGATATVKIFIEPQEGFDSYIAAGIVKKKVPAIITQNREEADFILSSVVLTNQESTGSKIARCLFAYCAGINGTQTATVQLVNLKKEVAWAYNVKKQGAKNFQSSSEAIAKHLKRFLEKK